MDYVVSALPIVLLIVLMLGFKVSGWLSAVITLAVTAVTAFWARDLGMMPEALGSASAGGVVGWSIAEGVCKALFPIFLIILAAIFSYNLLVASGNIETIKRQFTSLTDDRGILVLMMVWGFGGLLEGMAGFGTAVAIPAAILIGLGFKPFFSALVALLGNTVPTGFGAVGVPILTLCNEASADGSASPELITEISAFSVGQLAPFFFLVPFAILCLTDRKSVVKNVMLSLWVGAWSFGAQYLCARYLGVETPAIIGSLVAILSLIAAAKVVDRGKKSAASVAPKAAFKAWSIYICILLLILCAGPLCQPLNEFLRSHCVSRVHFPVIGSTLTFGWISNAAILIIIGTMAGGFIQGVGLRRQGTTFLKTLVSLKFTAITILSLIAMASVMNYSGMIATLANGIVGLTGDAYPLFAPLIGAVGTFVTGSDTSSNILFAKLQVSAAQKLGLTGSCSLFGISGSETNWLVAANTTGATGGKMISPQSIAIAVAACDSGNESDRLLRSALPFALAYIIVGGLIVYFGIN